jgi:hypothetical protein
VALHTVHQEDPDGRLSRAASNLSAPLNKCPCFFLHSMIGTFHVSSLVCVAVRSAAENFAEELEEWLY